MPMGTDPQAPPPTDPRDAEIANLKAQIAALQGSTTVASVQPVEAASAPVAVPVATSTDTVVQTVESAAAPLVQEAETAAENEFTHWLHLADGRVLKLVGTVTHWFDSPNGPAIPVIGVYPKQ